MLPDVEVAVSAAGASAVASAPLLTRPAVESRDSEHLLDASIPLYGVKCEQHQETHWHALHDARQLPLASRRGKCHYSGPHLL